MGRVWVLDTETKGTGAQMVPLEKVLRKPAPESAPIYVPPKRPEQQEKPPEPKRPRRFTVVDVMTQEVLAEDAGARATVDLLKGLRSVVDVRVYIGEDGGDRWRLLTLGEQQSLWGLRERPTTTGG